MTRRTLALLFVGIPMLWTCWLAYKLAELAVRGWYWIKGEKT